MGRTTDRLLASEVLPGMGRHCVVFHNGRGYYYTCKEFGCPPHKRMYECIDCRVTATMESEPGAPLIDRGEHNHPANLLFRDKCIVLHRIQQRFLEETTPATLILEDVLTSLSLHASEAQPAIPDLSIESVVMEENTYACVKEEPKTDLAEDAECSPVVIEESTYTCIKEEPKTDLVADDESSPVDLQETEFSVRPVIQTYSRTAAEDTLSLPMCSRVNLPLEFVDTGAEGFTAHTEVDDEQLSEVVRGRQGSGPPRKVRKVPRKQKLNSRNSMDIEPAKKIGPYKTLARQIRSESTLTSDDRTSIKPYSSRLSGKHFISRIPPMGKKAKPQKRCAVCYKSGLRKETIFWCSDCHVGLCVGDCFKDYHTKLNYIRGIAHSEDWMLDENQVKQISDLASARLKKKKTTQQIWKEIPQE